MPRTPPTRALALALAPFVVACSSASDPAPWAEGFASQGTIDTRLAVDPSGAVAVSGDFFGTIDFGGGIALQASQANSGFVGLLGPDGAPLWAETVTSSPEGVTSAAFAPDGNVVVAGGLGTWNLGGLPPDTPAQLNGDLYVSKLDRGGKPLWVELFGSDITGGPSAGYATLQSFAVDGGGDIALGGTVSGTFSFGGAAISPPSGQGCFVAKLDGSGGHVYDLSFGSYGSTVAAVAFDASGALIAGGVNGGSITIGGGDFTSGGDAGYVAKLDPSGTPAWAFQLGGISEVAALAADASGNVLVGGRFQGTLQADTLTVTTQGPSYQWSGFVLQVGPDGHPAWLVGLPLAEVRALSAQADGGAVVTGDYSTITTLGAATLPAPSFGSAPFVARIDGHGTIRAATAFVTSFPQGSTFGGGGVSPTSVAATPSGAVLGGSFGTDLQIGATTLQPTSPTDIFVARVAF